MTNRDALLNEIETLPAKYFYEVVDFVAGMKNKETLEKAAKTKTDDYQSVGEAYQAMAADTEREQEAREWCGAYFGPSRTK